MKTLVSSLALAALLPVAAQAYPAMSTADLNIRACPSTECLVLAVIPRGMPVEVIGKTGGWDFVTYAGVTGYAASSYLYAGYPAPLPPVAAYPHVTPYAYAAPAWDPMHDAWYKAPAFSLAFGFGL